MTDILIVEDNEELADILCDFLRAENYTVSVAKTGEKALSLYEKYGARPLRRTIQSSLEDRLAEEILDGAVKEGDEVLVSQGEAELKFSVPELIKN